MLLATSGLVALALCLVALDRERALRAVVARATERLALEGEACVSSRELEVPSPLPFLLVGFSSGPNLLLLSPALEEARGERRNVTIRVGRDRTAAPRTVRATVRNWRANILGTNGARAALVRVRNPRDARRRVPTTRTAPYAASRCASPISSARGSPTTRATSALCSKPGRR